MKKVAPRRAHVTVEGGHVAVVPEALVYDLGVNDGAMRLWLALRRHADGDGTSYPSRARLAKLLGCSPDTVDRRVATLVATGWLTVEPRHDALGSQRSNLYHLRMAALVPPQGRTDAAPGAADVHQGAQPQDCGPERGNEKNEGQMNEGGADAPAAAMPAAAADAAPPVAAGKGSRASTDAWRITTSVYANRDPRPVQRRDVVAALVDELLAAGWSPQEVEKAMMAVPTLSRGWLESELAKIRKQGQRRPVSDDRATSGWEEPW